MDGRRIDLVIVDLDEESRDLRCFARLLDAAEKVRAERYVFERDARRWTVSRGALRRILARRLKSDATSLRFETEANGKPCLAGGGVHFNLSHSAALAVVAVGEVPGIGVDVEFRRTISDRDAVVRQFFSAAEQESFFALPEHQRDLAFYTGWTRKEAVIKATGQGLSANLSAFDVTLAPTLAARVLRAENDDPARWQLHAFEPRPGYVAALAVPAADELQIATFDYSDYCPPLAIR